MTEDVKNANELNKFNATLRKILSVPRQEINRREEEWKREKERKKKAKTSPASHVSNESD